MQPLYDDPYGILMLVSTEQFDEQTRSLYRSVEPLSKPQKTTWFVRFKHWFLRKKNTLENG